MYGPFDIDLSKSIAANRRRGVDWLVGCFKVSRKEAGEIWDYLMDNFDKKYKRMQEEWPNAN